MDDLSSAEDQIEAELKPSTSNSNPELSNHHHEGETLLASIDSNSLEQMVCPICSREFKWRNLFENHVKRYRKCKECEKFFQNQRSLDKHMFRHIHDKPFKCPQCPRYFKNEDHVKKHIRIFHVAYETLPCPHCNKILKRQYALKFHIEAQHPETLPGYQKRHYECYICHRSSVSEGTLRTHMYLHDRPKNLLCPQCGKCFSSQSAMKLHLMSDTHNTTGEVIKPYLCQYCHKGHASSSALKRHINIHTGEKPFACKECGKRFGNTSNLSQHRLIHMNEKRHHCKLCDHKSRSAGNLQKHMRVHTG